MDTTEIVVRLIADCHNPGALDRMTQVMNSLPEDQQAEVWGRLTDTTPNPTGDQ